MFIHKETFYQDYSDVQGMPSHWVVQYWEDNPFGTPLVNYFRTLNEAKSFESTLTNYDDWYTSQEILLPTQ